MNEQTLELERIVSTHNVDRDMLVCAISHVGIDVLLNCIDACDYDWIFNGGSFRPECSYQGKLLLILMDNGFDGDLWC